MCWRSATAAIYVWSFTVRGSALKLDCLWPAIPLWQDCLMPHVALQDICPLRFFTFGLPEYACLTQTRLAKDECMYENL